MSFIQRYRSKRREFTAPHTSRSKHLGKQFRRGVAKDVLHFPFLPFRYVTLCLKIMQTFVRSFDLQMPLEERMLGLRLTVSMLCHDDSGHLSSGAPFTDHSVHRP